MDRTEHKKLTFIAGRSRLFSLVGLALVVLGISGLLNFNQAQVLALSATNMTPTKGSELGGDWVTITS